MQADSHLDENASPELYRRTLANAIADSPDFHIDLGDTFMTDKHPSRDSTAKQYLAQRYYLGLIGRSAPIFLVLGNHDGEDAKLLRGGAGHVRVTVSPAQVKVEYVRAFLPTDETGRRKNGQVGHAYTIVPRPH